MNQINQGRASTGGILKKDNVRQNKKISWAQARVRLLGTDNEYKENIESIESSFTFRESLPMQIDRTSLDVKSDVIQPQQWQETQPIQRLSIDPKEFNDMFALSSNQNTIVVPSEHNLDQFQYEKAIEKNDLKVQPQFEQNQIKNICMEWSLTQFSDFELRNQKQSWSPVTQRLKELPQPKQNNSEWVSRMSQFVRESIHAKTQQVNLINQNAAQNNGQQTLNQPQQNTAQNPQQNEDLQKDQKDQVAQETSQQPQRKDNEQLLNQSNRKTFGSVLKEQKIEFHCDKNISLEERQQRIQNLQQKLIQQNSSQSSWVIVEPVKTPALESSKKVLYNPSQNSVQLNKSLKSVDRAQLQFIQERINFLENNEEEHSINTQLQNMVTLMFQHIKNETDLFEQHMQSLEQEQKKIEQEEQLSVLQIYILRKYISNVKSTETKILYKKLFNITQMHFNTMRNAIEKTRTQKQNNRAVQELSKIIIEKITGVKIINVIYFPKSKTHEIILKFGSNLITLLSVEEDLQQVSKIKCWLENNAYQNVHFDEESEQEPGSLLQDVILRMHYEQNSPRPMSLMETIESLRENFKAYNDVFQSLQKYLKNDQDFKIKMEKSGKIVCITKISRIPYLQIEFILELDKNRQWVSNFKVHCLNNANHKVLQDARKQVSVEIHESQRSLPNNAPIQEKLKCVQKLLKSIDYMTVKQKISSMEIQNTDRQLPLFEYN